MANWYVIAEFTYIRSHRFNKGDHCQEIKDWFNQGKVDLQELNPAIFTPALRSSTSNYIVKYLKTWLVKNSITSTANSRQKLWKANSAEIQLKPLRYDAANDPCETLHGKQDESWS